MCGVMAIGIGLTLMSTFAQIQGAKAAGKHERNVLEGQRKTEVTAQALQKEDRARRMRSAIATQKAEFGASGALIETGVLAQTAGEFSREQFAADFNSDIRLQNIFSKKQSSKINQRNSVTGSLFDAGANMFGLATGPLSQ